ncbi:MAG: hypothetical protein HY900_00720 [Deltaproteobacteria bacterium]|nr:hypothetical protein [Deltaproteobacteria bacterium]
METSSGPSSQYPVWALWQFWGEMLKACASAVAPRELNQPILPGWAIGNVITVTGRNSTAPETERDVVAQHSYGRQLGRIGDALAVLIEERPSSAPVGKELLEFRKMHDEIREVKKETAVRRLERIVSDLDRLRAESPEEHRRLVSDLWNELKKASGQLPGS